VCVLPWTLLEAVSPHPGCPPKRGKIIVLVLVLVHVLVLVLVDVDVILPRFGGLVSYAACVPCGYFFSYSAGE
jgi:hypothetical protein